MKEEKETTVPVSGSAPSMQERRLPEFNAMQKVKRRFFAMRNGDLARQMAVRGAGYRINFGLNLPQISDIARDFLPGGREWESLSSGDGLATPYAGFDMAGFARRLRDNTTTRESMLIAPMLFPVDRLTGEEALAWMRSVPTPEVADVLCLKLLRRHPCAPSLVSTLLNDGQQEEADDGGGADNRSELARYCALRLLMNLLQSGKVTATAAMSLLTAQSTHVTPMTAGIIRQLHDEISFLSGRHGEVSVVDNEGKDAGGVEGDGPEDWV